MIAEILKKYPFIVLDGAFSTELEKQGFAINDELWSAIALYKNPELVEAVHLSYYEAGADIVTSASYQATVDGFEKKGFSKEEAASLIQSSIALVQDARDEYLSSHEEENRPAPLTAASVGPYGAYLADGSEYRGDYGKTREELADFHRERIHILAEADTKAICLFPRSYLLRIFLLFCDTLQSGSAVAARHPRPWSASMIKSLQKLQGSSQ